MLLCEDERGGSMSDFVWFVIIGVLFVLLGLVFILLEKQRACPAVFLKPHHWRIDYGFN